MKAFELKIPPLVVTILFGLLMWGVKRLFPGWDFEVPYRPVVGVMMALVALAITAAASFELRRARTTLNPLKPAGSSSLVTSGIYRFSRNPIYLGFLLLLVGLGPVSSNFAALLLTPAYVAYMNRFQIIPEERILGELFGEEYQSYCQKTRRWLG